MSKAANTSATSNCGRSIELVPIKCRSGHTESRPALNGNFRDLLTKHGLFQLNSESRRLAFARTAQQRCFHLRWIKRVDDSRTLFSKITKARAERIALTKVPGGSIRSAELETARGQHFWSVYIARPGSKNAKENRVDATSGQILVV